MRFKITYTIVRRVFTSEKDNIVQNDLKLFPYAALAYNKVRQVYEFSLYFNMVLMYADKFGPMTKVF